MSTSAEQSVYWKVVTIVDQYILYTLVMILYFGMFVFEIFRVATAIDILLQGDRAHDSVSLRMRVSMSPLSSKAAARGRHEQTNIVDSKPTRRTG